jgi:rod shape-determining protein MreD
MVLVLETVLMPYIRIFGVAPDLLLVVTVSTGLLYGTREGVAAGLFCGFVTDLMRGRFLGLSAFSKGLTGFLFGLLSERIFKDNLLVPLISGLAGTVIDQLLFLVFGHVVGQTLFVWPGIYRIILPMAIYDAILSPVTFTLTHNLTRPIAKMPGRGPRGLI